MAGTRQKLKIERSSVSRGQNPNEASYPPTIEEGLLRSMQPEQHSAFFPTIYFDPEMPCPISFMDSFSNTENFKPLIRRLFSTGAKPKKLDVILAEIFEKFPNYLNEMDRGIGALVADSQRRHLKNDTEAATYHRYGLEYGFFSNINNALTSGTKPMIATVLESRAKILFEKGQMAAAVRDIEYLLANDNPDNPELIGMAVSSYYILAANSFDTGGYGLKYSLDNLEKAEQLILRLNMFATLDEGWKYMRNKIWSRVNLQDIQKLKGEILKTFKVSPKVGPEKRFINLFGPKSKVDFDSYGNLIAASTLNPNERIFSETFAAFVIDKANQNRICSECGKSTSQFVFPCYECNEVVFCDYTCQQIAKHGRHSRTCRFSAGNLASIANDKQMALCYDLMASLPISQVIEFSRNSTAAVYYHILKHANRYSFPLFTYYSLLWTGGIQEIENIDLQNERNQELLYKAIQLAVVLKHQFKLTRKELMGSSDQLQDDNVLAKVEDIQPLVRIVFAAFVCLAEQPKELKPETTQNIRLYGIKLFGSQLIHGCPSIANVKTAFENGRIVYLAKDYIEPGGYLAIRSDAYPSVNCRKGNCEWCNLMKQEGRIMKKMAPKPEDATFPTGDIRFGPRGGPLLEEFE